MRHGMVGVQMRRMMAGTMARRTPGHVMERLSDCTQDSLSDGIAKNQHTADLTLEN